MSKTKLFKFSTTLVTTVGLFIFAPAAWASFSADFNMTLSGHEKNQEALKMKSRYHFDGENFRVDNPGMFGMGPTSHITNAKKKMIYIIDHQSKTYEELPLVESKPKTKEKEPEFLSKDDLSIETYQDKGWEVKKIGKDQVENIPCTVFQAREKGSADYVEVCSSEKLDNMPLRMTSKTKKDGNMEMLMSNIKVGGISADTFLPPKGYAKGKPQHTLTSPADFEKQMKEMEKHIQNMQKQQGNQE